MGQQDSVANVAKGCPNPGLAKLSGPAIECPRVPWVGSKPLGAWRDCRRGGVGNDDARVGADDCGADDDANDGDDDDEGHVADDDDHCLRSREERRREMMRRWRGGGDGHDDDAEDGDAEDAEDDDDDDDDGDDDDDDGTKRAPPKILELRAGLVGGESRTPEWWGAPHL